MNGLIRIPPPEAVLRQLFGAWRADLENTWKFNTEARDYIACRLMTKIGVRINETTKLDLDDIKDNPDLGKLPKLHIRYGKGAYGSGPKDPRRSSDQRRRRSAGVVHPRGQTRVRGRSILVTAPQPAVLLGAAQQRRQRQTRRDLLAAQGPDRRRRALRTGGGPGRSRPTCAGTTARLSSTASGLTWWPSKRSSATSGLRQLCGMSSPGTCTGRARSRRSPGHGGVGVPLPALEKLLPDQGQLGDGSV
jgi:hypothetical protein